MPQLNTDVLRRLQRFPNTPVQRAFDSFLNVSRISRRSFLTTSAASAAYSMALSEPHAAISPSFPWLGQRPYRFFLQSGATWTVDPRSFEGFPKLSVRETPSTITIAFTGAVFPGTDLSADFICNYERSTDVIRFELVAFDLHGSAIASDWVLGITPITSLISPNYWQLNDGVRLEIGAGGRASLFPDWHLLLSNLDQCHLVTANARLPIDNAEIRINSPEKDSFISGEPRPNSTVTVERNGQDWGGTSFATPFHFSGLWRSSPQFKSAIVELKRDAEQLNSYAFVLSDTSRQIDHPIEIHLADQEDRISLSVSQPYLASFHSNLGTETMFLGTVANDYVQYSLAGCSFELGCNDHHSLLTLTAANGDLQRVAFDGVVKRAALPVDDGAVSLFIEQPLSSRFEFIVSKSSAQQSLESSGFLNISDSPTIVAVQNPRLHVLRPDDRLDLIFELSNLAVHFSKNRPTEFQRIDHDAKAQLVVHFAGQHLAEKTFFTTDSGGGDPITLPPVPTRLSGPTRLVFDIVGDSPLPFSLDTLLSWQRFTPSLVNSLRPPRLIAEPELSQTAIEAPFRLTLSPDGQHHWIHKTAPLRHGDRTELWHTRLVGGRDPTYPDALRFVPAKLRAVWSPDYDGSAEALPFDTSLSPSDRKDIVTVTHDATVIATPVQGKKFLLSGFGAYLDLEGRFPYDCHSPVSLEVWLHQATLGQDNKALISRRGFLYPFGHRVSLIRLTTREAVRIEPTMGGPDAQGEYLRTRLFIVIREKIKEYSSRTDAWSLPFKSIEIDFPRTPPLDLPRGVEISEIPGTFWDTKAFWPTVDGNLLEFPATGLDWAGKPCTFSAPLLFIEYDAAALDGRIEIDPAGEYLKRLADVKAEYTRSGRGKREIGRTEVAVAPPNEPNDTAVDILTIQFEATDDPQPVCPVEQPQFKIAVPKLEARLPSLKGLLRDDENKAWFALADTKTTAAEVFLVATPGIDAVDKERIRLGFGGQTEKSGGIAATSLTVGGVSTIYGVYGSKSAMAFAGGSAVSAVGKPGDLMGDGKFDPSDYLDTDATICGCIRIGDIIEKGLSVTDAQMPKILSKLRLSTDEGPMSFSQSVDWNTVQLKNWPDGDEAIFVTQQGSPALVADPSRPTQFQISARASVDIRAPDKPTAAVRASLTNFSAQLLFNGNGVLVRCGSLEFSISESGQTAFNVDIQSVELVGPFLSFVKAIEDFIASLLGDTGISIRISSTGVVITLPSYNVPAITMGAFSLLNLSIGSSFELSFRSEPATFKTYFSTPENPFLVSFGTWGGGGAVTFVTDIRRVVLFSATFTFGAFCTLSLVVASGTAAVLGGLTYTSKTTGSGDAVRTEIDYDFFVHAYGSVTAYGFITVGVDFYLVLTISEGPPSESKGSVSVSYSIKIGFFKKKFTLTYSRKFAGSGKKEASIAGVVEAAPAPAVRKSKLSDVLSFDDWKTYRRAFAA